MEAIEENRVEMEQQQAELLRLGNKGSPNESMK
jgi:hypothetical protein